MRFHRMQDRNVNWIPGMDHAGIATQALFDKELRRNGENRFEIGREQYTDMVLSFCVVSLRANRMEPEEPATHPRATPIDGRSPELEGRSSAAFRLSFQYYTIDKKRQVGVTNAFIELFKQGAIYRGEKMLHFCPTLQSVVSDIEVDWIVPLSPSTYA